MWCPESGKKHGWKHQSKADRVKVHKKSRRKGESFPMETDNNRLDEYFEELPTRKNHKKLKTGKAGR